ncbi:MAG: IclR family transcriptional regulator [Nocardioidaceae bacterium]
MKQRTYGSGLVRDIEILEVLALPVAAAGLGVSRVAALAGRDKAQVSRALATLCEAGLVARDEPTRMYRPGWRMFALASHAAETHLARVGAAYLREVVAGINETTHLCVLRGDKVVTVRSESGSHAFRGVGWEGTEVDPYTTSAGRALMSDWDDDGLAAWWRAFPYESGRSASPSAIPSQDVERESAPTVTLERVVDGVRAVRSSGYAAVDEEFEPGLVGVSAPVRGFRGDVVAALNVSAPKHRLGRHLSVAGEFTLSVAERMSDALGAPRRT